MNKITITARLTGNPEKQVTKSGKNVAVMNVAVNEKLGGNAVTTFFRVNVWNQMGENVVKYLTKGSLVLIEGREDVNAYTASDGTLRVNRVINASNVEFIGSKPTSAPQTQAAPAEPEPVPVEELGDDVPW